MLFVFFFKQKTAYEMCGRDWSSDVCSSDLLLAVVAILAVSELPQGILFVLSSVLYEFYDTVHLQLGNLLDVLALMSGSINFILFCSMSSQFRKTLASTLHLSHTHPNG